MWTFIFINKGFFFFFLSKQEVDLLKDNSTFPKYLEWAGPGEGNCGEQQRSLGFYSSEENIQG